MAESYQDTPAAKKKRAESAMRHSAYMRSRIDKIKALRMEEKQRIEWLEKKVQSLETKLRNQARSTHSEIAKLKSEQGQ